MYIFSSIYFTGMLNILYITLDPRLDDITSYFLLPRKLFLNDFFFFLNDLSDRLKNLLVRRFICWYLHINLRVPMVTKQTILLTTDYYELELIELIKRSVM